MVKMEDAITAKRGRLRRTGKLKQKNKQTHGEVVQIIKEVVVQADPAECELETEASQMDESDCVDVEAGDDDMDASSVPSTPTPTRTPTPKGATQKRAEAKRVSATLKVNTNALSSTPTTSKSQSLSTISTSAVVGNTKRSKKRRDSGTSSEEERWLTAIESGKLEDVDDELKKIKDPKLMTARQRAMYVRNMDQEGPPPVELLMSLPTGYREKEKPQTAEELQKAALKSQKRKQLADEKREKDKKKTMERLLKKQESKQRSAVRKQATKITQPMITYQNTPDGSFIHLPPDHEFPLQPQMSRDPPKVQLCVINGCGKPKVYNCSKTNVPLCSFSCYRKNVQSFRQIVC